MSKKSKIKPEDLNEGHYTEAIDRAYITANFMEEVLINHPLIECHKELKERVEKAQQLILDVYQLIGGLTVERFGSNVSPENQEDTK
jgi:hypothetical protein